MRNDTDLGPPAVASFVRGELARALRSRRPYTVNLLLGGMDPITNKPNLYWIDYLAALAPVPYAAHGYAQYGFHLLESAPYLSSKRERYWVFLQTGDANTWPLTGTTASPSSISTTTRTSPSTRE